MTSWRSAFTSLGAAGVIAALSLSGAAIAQQGAPPPPTTFRGSIDLIRLDVSVLDADRRPVTGLTSQDFTIVEDGQLRPIATFAAIDLPGPAPVSAAWMRDTSPDVATNEHAGGQALVIVIDDAAINGTEAVAITKTMEIASAAVRELGPQDQAAVVFTEYNHGAQDFTSDKARLLAAIANAYLFPARDPAPDQRGSCLCRVCSVRVLEKAAASLRQLTEQRKTVLFISAGLALPDGVDLQGSYDGFSGAAAGCLGEQVSRTIAAIREAQLTNVTVHAIDPIGLAAPDLTDVMSSARQGRPSAASRRIEFLRALAANTGGRAVVNTNAPEASVPAIMNETRSYYLLGFVPGAKPKGGGFHPITVRVDRPGVEVRTRRGYYTPTEKERRSEQLHATGVDRSIEAPLPSAGVPLAVAAAPFLDARGQPVTAVVLNVSQPREAGTAPKKERVEVIASAFGQEVANSVQTQRQTLEIVWTPAATSTSQYEVRSRLRLPPGRYELRLGVKSPERDGSVYAYVDVPKLDKDDLAVSGIVVASDPALKAAPATAFADFLRVAPTARRDFQAGDRATIFLRVYQKGAKHPRPVIAAMRVFDAHDRQVADSEQRLDADVFSAAKTADYSAPLPLDRLEAGEYVAKIDISNGAKTVDRAVRFRVR